MKRSLPLAALVLCALFISGAKVEGDGPTQIKATASRTLTLEVTRPFIQLGSIPPYHTIIYNSAAAQRLYSTALALPHYPHYPNNESHCLVMGVVYHLTFMQGGRAVHQIDVQPDGCAVLSLSRSDERIALPSFQEMLAKTLQLSSLIPVIHIAP